jgi:hypothetical protein
MKAWKFVALLYVLLAGLVIGSHCQTTQVHTFAKAIARTEGFYIKGTIPNRLHNPGDIMTSLPHAYPGQTGIYKHYAVFRSDKWGWLALENQIQKVIDGTSTKYTQDMTMVQIAKVYAENWRYWGRTVCKILQISPQLTFQEYFGLAPRVKFTREFYGRISQEVLRAWARYDTEQPTLLDGTQRRETATLYPLPEAARQGQDTGQANES